MTKQALYHYFPSKEALLRGMVSTLLEDEIEALLAVIEAPDFGERSFGKLIRAFDGRRQGEGFGTSQAVCGDADGDGVADLCIGAWQNADGATSAGKALRLPAGRLQDRVLPVTALYRRQARH